MNDKATIVGEEITGIVAIFYKNISFSKFLSALVLHSLALS